MKLGTDCSGIESVYEALNQLKINIEYEFASEINESCIETLKANFPKPRIFNYDIKKRDITTLPKNIDLYVCGFPCQPFSSAGLKLGKADKRSSILNHCIKTIEYVKPKIFILENVKNFKNIQDGKIFKATITRLEKNNKYKVYSDVLNAKNYGVPQNRERLFIIGIRNDCLKRNYIYTTPSFLIIKPISNFLLKIKGTLPVPKSIQNVFNKHKFKIDIKKPIILSTGGFGTASNISPTITHSHKHYIYKQKRYLTSTEALLLQGFPKNFKHVVTETELYKQAGNSMSIHVLKALFKQLFKFL